MQILNTLCRFDMDISLKSIVQELDTHIKEVMYSLEKDQVNLTVVQECP